MLVKGFRLSPPRLYPYILGFFNRTTLAHITAILGPHWGSLLGVPGYWFRLYSSVVPGRWRTCCDDCCINLPSNSRMSTTCNASICRGSRLGCCIHSSALVLLSLRVFLVRDEIIQAPNSDYAHAKINLMSCITMRIGTSKPIQWKR